MIRMSENHIRSNQSASEEWPSYRFVKGLLGHLFLDIRGDRFLGAARDFLDSELGEYFWDASDFALEDRIKLLRITEEKMTKVQSKYPWFWQVYDEVWAELPQEVQAVLKVEPRIEIQFLAPSRFEKRFPNFGPMAYEPQGRGGEVLSHTFYVNLHFREIMRAGSKDQWQQAMKATIAHELAHIYLKHYLLWPVADSLGISEDHGKAIRDYHEKVADFQSWAWGFGMMTVDESGRGI